MGGSPLKNRAPTELTMIQTLLIGNGVGGLGTQTHTVTVVLTIWDSVCGPQMALLPHMPLLPCRFVQKLMAHSWILSDPHCTCRRLAVTESPT